MSFFFYSLVLLPAPDLPHTKLSGLNILPMELALTLSRVPGSRSVKMARGIQEPLDAISMIIFSGDSEDAAILFVLYTE